MTDFEGKQEPGGTAIEEPDVEEPLTYQAPRLEDRPAEVDAVDWLEQQHEEPVDDEAADLGEAP